MPLRALDPQVGSGFSLPPATFRVCPGHRSYAATRRDTSEHRFPLRYRTLGADRPGLTLTAGWAGRPSSKGRRLPIGIRNRYKEGPREGKRPVWTGRPIGCPLPRLDATSPGQTEEASHGVEPRHYVTVRRCHTSPTDDRPDRSVGRHRRGRRPPLHSCPRRRCPSASQPRNRRWLRCPGWLGDHEHRPYDDQRGSRNVSDNDDHRSRDADRDRNQPRRRRRHAGLQDRPRDCLQQRRRRGANLADRC